jgi:hypothetical protein
LHPRPPHGRPPLGEVARLRALVGDAAGRVRPRNAPARLNLAPTPVAAAAPASRAFSAKVVRFVSAAPPLTTLWPTPFSPPPLCAESPTAAVNVACPSRSLALWPICI